MSENRRLRSAAIILFSMAILSFNGDLEYRDVIGGQLKILIPKDFIHVSKEAFKLHYIGDIAPDDFYCNQDTSESVGFLKLPQRINDIGQMKQMGQMALSDSAIKVHFNDTLTVNGQKIYLLDIDGMDVGKLRNSETFVFNTRSGTIMGIISCDIKLKDKWKPIRDQIFKSIQVTRK